MRFSIAATTLVASFLAGLAAADPIKAVAYIYGTTPAVSGWVSLTQDSYDAPTYIRANLTGLTPGKHGIHVHEFGDITNGCESTGVHFNPFNKVHGGPDDEIRHYGDFGNIDVGTDYYAILDLSSDMVKLSGENSALGHAIVVHSGTDDLGKGDSPLSKTTGNSGIKIACGVIGFAMTD